MATGGRVATEHQTRNKVQFKKRGWDESDKNYMVGVDDEFDESEDEYCYSLADDETEESFGEFVEEDRRKKVKRVGRPRGQRSSRGRNGTVKRRKKNAAYCAENGGAKGRKKGIQGRKKDAFGGKLRMRTLDSSAKRKADHSNGKPKKETNVPYLEGEDSDWNDSDSDEDGEFIPDEVDGEEELPVMKKNKVNKLRVKETQGADRKKQKRKLKNLKSTLKRNQRRNVLGEKIDVLLRSP